MLTIWCGVTPRNPIRIRIRNDNYILTHCDIVGVNDPVSVAIGKPNLKRFEWINIHQLPDVIEVHSYAVIF